MRAVFFVIARDFTFLCQSWKRNHPVVVFSFCREAILRTAKTLVEDTKNLVSAAQASQDVLASAAEAAVGSVSNLADNVKLGALALGPDDSDAQVKCLNVCGSMIDSLY